MAFPRLSITFRQRNITFSSMNSIVFFFCYFTSLKNLICSPLSLTSSVFATRAFLLPQNVFSRFFSVPISLPFKIVRFTAEYFLSSVVISLTLRSVSYTHLDVYKRQVCVYSVDSAVIVRVMKLCVMKISSSLTMVYIYMSVYSSTSGMFNNV